MQVEWLECSSFLQWQLYVETSSVQVQVQVHPHIIDTALKYLTFCHSRTAPGGDSSSASKQDGVALDKAYLKFYQEKRATA